MSEDTHGADTPTRRGVLRTMGVLAGIGAVGTTPVTATSHGTLVNAEIQSSGAIVATDDDFIIAGQQITVDGEEFYKDGNDSYVIYNDGYSGEIYDNELTVNSVASLGSSNATYGVRVKGGSVDVTDNVVDANDDINRRFAAVRFSDGATGGATDNQITGAHRVGVLATGSGTDVEIANNELVGPGPRQSGWADNGIQLSDAATGTVRDNLVTDHWYEPNTFVSSGLISYTDDVVVQRNTFTNNDLGIGLSGDRNNVIHNTVEVTYTTTSTEHYGIYELGGESNGIRQNTVTTDADENGLIGLIVLGTNAKLIRNDLSGWETLILDAGDDTKLPQPFDPE